MSRIDKLSISGVRSFSPAVREAIQFNTPLTLIVGYNGSGKTTIIECLKYATTGEQPPNSKVGGAFIHDPKLAGEKEVLAQVKLQFRSINDRQHNSRTLKTLDCSLVVVNNGERTTTSTRTAQLDEMIPERLGVSRAVLDAVIFCHQDESLWPLSEPSALKKRFDEIFEAQKYTKAIENLKVLRKKQAHNKANKDRGQRAEKLMSGLQIEIETARDKCEDLTKEMEETQVKIKQKHQQANSFLQILEYRQDAINELKQTIDELPETDDALERALSQYEESMGRYQEEAEQNKAQYAELQQELTNHRQSQSAKLAEQGKLQSDKEKYERQLKARVQLVQEAASQYNFRGFDEDLTDQHIQAFQDKIQKLLTEKRRDLERLQKENAAELDKATGVITELEGRKAARTQDRVSAKQRMGAIEKRTSVLQNEAGNIDLDELESRFKHAQQELEKSNWDQQLTEANDKQWQLDNENEKLGRELVECTRLASERAQLELRKKEMSDRKRKLDTLVETWKPKLSAAIGDDWEPHTLDSRFQSIQSRQSKAVQEAQKRRDQTRQKQQKVEYKLKTAKETHSKKTQEMNQRKQKVVAALQNVRDNAVVEDYVDEVAAMEQQVEELRTDLSLFDALFDYYNKCKRMLDTQKKCRLCDRHFDDGQSAALDRLGKKIDKHLDPKGKVDTEKDLKEAVDNLEAMRAVRSAFDTYERLSAELPALQDEWKTAENEFETLEKELEEEDSLVAAAEEKLRDLGDLAKTIANISQTVREIKDAEAQVDRIVSQQSSGGVTRSVEEIHELQSSISEQIRTLKNKITNLTADRQRMKDQINSLELEKSELRNKIGRTAGQLEKKKDLQSQIQTLKEDYAHQREVIQRTDEELEKLEPSITEARSARDEILRHSRSKEQVITDERDAIASSIAEIKKMDNDIQDYLDRGGLTNLASNQRALASLDTAISTTEKEIADLTVRTNKLKQDIDSGDRKRKNISDNLNYRKHLQTLDVLRKDIEDLEDRNAHEDYERLHSEARSLENTANRLVAERGSVMGTMKSKDEELGRLLEEWEMDFRDAKQKYRESHIRVETTKAAIQDLNQCVSAVDKAVMQYHTMKMEDVNRIASELWQTTYQGTDIDTILIRSDNDTTNKKRNYNYRLCMVKQDTEMDMRGRCSAGQKVLASIIIRLALAESFGVNCGLIALDEPTTNLDRDNIKSLAESLHRIIKTRQQQSNFQLIVITHDEEFLRHMRCSDFCDSFFRVKRDEKQNSVISRESITKIF
ncbi:AAA domain-containing protein [Trichoderma sp. TUCIM 5745]